MCGGEIYCTDPCAGKETHCTDPSGGKEFMALCPCVRKGYFQGYLLTRGLEKKWYCPQAMEFEGELEQTH